MDGLASILLVDDNPKYLADALPMYGYDVTVATNGIDALKELNADIKQVVWVITPLLEKNNFSEIKKYCSDFEKEKIRITIIKNDGTVLADSISSKTNLENHSNRPEV